jgi:hypothetical protein
MTKCVCGSDAVLHIGREKYCARCFREGGEWTRIHGEVVPNKRRSKTELETFIKSLLNNYDSYTAVFDKDKAKTMIIRSYDDLEDWLYENTHSE